MEATNPKINPNKLQAGQDICVGNKLIRRNFSPHRDRKEHACLIQFPIACKVLSYKK